MSGTCHSAKMNRTIIVRRNYLHWVKKYQRQALACLFNFPATVSSCFFLDKMATSHPLFLNAKLYLLSRCYPSDMRRGTQTSQHTSPHASVSEKETMSSLVNAGLYSAVFFCFKSNYFSSHLQNLMKYICFLFILQAIIKDSEVQCVEGNSSRIFWWCKESFYRHVRGLILK